MWPASSINRLSERPSSSVQQVPVTGKAGERSLAGSSLIEGIEQLTRALAQIATLPGTPALRRGEIKLQVALITPLLNVKGYAAPETRAAAERARLLIEQAEALGEPPEDPLLLFSVLFGFWIMNFTAFNGDAVLELAAQFLALAEKQGATAPLLIAHHVMANSLTPTGDFAQGLAHFDRALALFDPVAHRALGAHFAIDVGCSTLFFRSWALWMLGHPDAARAGTERVLEEAREIGEAITLMFALNFTSLIETLCGNSVAVNALSSQLVALADEKDSPYWQAWGVILQGCVSALTGKAAGTIQMLTSGVAAYRSCGTTVFMPWVPSILAGVHADLGQFDDAWRWIGEAITIVEVTKERWWEAEVNRVAGEITLKSAESDTERAEAYFKHALAIAREQQAKSWELRTATSMARLWCNQGKRDAARDLLAPVYGWFTEGFDTLDLKEAKALLEEFAA